jgi:SHC-transforming protein 1
MQGDKNFLSRPTRDLLRFPESEALTGNGVSFQVKYIGCVEVFASMKVLDFQTRSAVARLDLKSCFLFQILTVL